LWLTTWLITKILTSYFLCLIRTWSKVSKLFPSELMLLLICRTNRIFRLYVFVVNFIKCCFVLLFRIHQEGDGWAAGEQKVDRRSVHSASRQQLDHRLETLRVNISFSSPWISFTIVAICGRVHHAIHVFPCQFNPFTAHKRACS